LVEDLGVGLAKNIEFGWKFIRPVSVGVLWSMNALHRVIPNYGWVIVIISVLTKVLFYRLTHKSFTSMKEMQDLQPRIAALKEKFGNDRRRLSEETMKLYKEAGVNPLGGCLPMLLQMPVFVALFNVLSHAIEQAGRGSRGSATRRSRTLSAAASLPLVGDNPSCAAPDGRDVGAVEARGSPTGQPATRCRPASTRFCPSSSPSCSKMPGLVIYWIINTGCRLFSSTTLSRRQMGLAVVVDAPVVKRRTRKGS
jgi:hypothetical protein